jgi:hypothetical protein
MEYKGKNNLLFSERPQRMKMMGIQKENTVACFFLWKRRLS